MELTRTHVIVGTVALIVTLGVGFIIGHFTVETKSSSEKEILRYYRSIVEESNPDGLQELVKTVSPQILKKNLREMTREPHMAGTIYDKISADYVRNSFESSGLDVVELFDYDVLLDYPDDDKFNNVEIKTSNDELEKKYEIKEPTFGQADLDKVPKSFLAYSIAGSVTSVNLYYVNYCMEPDFEELVKRNISVKNAIVLCRYGKIFRGNKVEIAESYGAIGCLLFDDPRRSAPEVAAHRIYPNGEFLPSGGTQRGSIYTDNGDPLTPLYPSTEYAYRWDPEKINTLPKITAQVIGYEVAYDLFKLIEGNNNPVLNEWAGDMNITYVYGGKLSDERSLTLNVFNKMDVRKTYNVMGLIKGSIEEDRYVIVGNHRDAWSLGAMDPTSGTAVILELARVLMTMKKNGSWKPKRSVLFMSWGAEEYGLIGSVEWVEEYQKKLEANSISYFNIDTVVKGNFAYRALASPILYDFIYDVTKSIKQTSQETVFDRWIKNDPNPTPNGPKISPYLGSGSDHMPFLQRVGIPCVEQSIMRDRTDPLFTNIELGSYPTYHTSYETFELIEQYLDPNFESFGLITTIVGELTRRISEALILPFNCVTYAEELEKEFSDFEKTYKNDFETFNLNFDHLRWAITNFTRVAKSFHQRLDSLDKSKYHLVRMINDQLRGVEKAFLNPYNVERKGYNHMIFSPSIVDSYGSDVFPSITDTIYSYKKTPSPQLLEEIRLQYSILIHSVQSASSILKESFDFKRYVY